MTLARSMGLLILALLAFAPPGAAMGRPLIHFYGLREVAEEGGFASLGTVETSEPELVLRVERTYTTSKLWRKPGEGAPGTTIKLPMHQPRGSALPEESFQDWRLIDGKTSAASGERVIAVRYQIDTALLPATAPNLRKLELLFEKKGFEPSPEDLKDRDLCKLAYDTLVAQKRLRDADLLAAAPEILELHLRTLPTAATRHFVAELAPVAVKDAEKLRAFTRVLMTVRDPSVVGAMAPLFATEAPAAQAELWNGLSQWDHLASAGEAPAPDLSPLAEVLPFDRVRTDEAFGRLFERLNPAAKAQVLARALRSNLVPLSATSEERPRLLQALVPFVRKAPDPSLLVELRRLDPLDPGWSWPSIIATSLVEMATAITRAHPETRTATQAWLEPMLAAGISADNEAVRAWRELCGPAAALPPLPSKELALAEGERRYEPSGLWLMRKAGVIEVRRGSDRRRLREDFDEGPLGSPTLVITQGAKVSFSTYTGLSHWDDAQAIAQKAAQGAGCGSVGAGTQEGDTGVMTFVAPGKAGASCTIRVALFTDRVDVTHGEHSR